jgi:tRNA threonylcarbamoyladenosine biosynthesis protein TsaB
MVGSLALLDGADRLEERTLELGTGHGRSLIPEIRRLLCDRGRTPRDCELLAVSIGPGSFTGLRVGVVCAITWAYATGCRVVAVDTHRAIAGNTPNGISRVEVVSDAQRGDLYSSRFVRDGEARWQEVDPLGFLPATEWLTRLDSDAVVTGPGLEKLHERIAGRCRLLERPLWRPCAAEVGRLGVEQAAAGGFADFWSLEPLYLRRSSAEEKWDLRKRP